MKKTFLKFGVAGSALLTFIGSFAFVPKPYSNLVYAERITSTSFSYTNVNPLSAPGCHSDVATVACTLSTTATAAYFNANNVNSFPLQSSVPGNPVVAFHHAGSIHK